MMIIMGKLILISFVLCCTSWAYFLKKEEQIIIQYTDTFVEATNILVTNYYIHNNQLADNFLDLDSWFLYESINSISDNSFYDPDDCNDKSIDCEQVMKDKRMDINIEYSYNSYSILINNVDLGWYDCDDMRNNINKYIKAKSFDDPTPEIVICENNSFKIIFNDIDVKKRAELIKKDKKSRIGKFLI